MYSIFVILLSGIAAAISAGFAVYHFLGKGPTSTVAFYSGGTVLMVLWTLITAMVVIAKHSKFLTC